LGEVEEIRGIIRKEEGPVALSDLSEMEGSGKMVTKISEFRPGII